MPPLAKRYRIEYFRKRRSEARAMIDAARDVPCMDCKQRFPPVCMDFDHRDPKAKKFCVSGWWNRASSLETLQREIDKCDVVCANCHRIRTQAALVQR